MAKDNFTKDWIIENSIEIVSRYEPGELTIRALHYQLVAIGMTNTMSHYKRVVNAMETARWDNLIEFEAFSDHDRSMIGKTKFELTNVQEKVEEAKEQVEAWMTSYRKNRWEDQFYYPEIFIEKKALQGIFDKPCAQKSVTLGACKGYPSLTFLNEAAQRFIAAEELGHKPIILYFGDYDPSGEDIPRSIEANLNRFGVSNLEVRRIALMEDQVKEWNLPPAPAKDGDSRTANWGGLGQVELDAVNPKKLQNMCLDAIQDIFDEDTHDKVLLREKDERKDFRKQLKLFVNTLHSEEEDED